jgi:NADH dehydrogenase [ubiquinone] 1 alpha subcomplex assembly factor 1
MRQNRCWKRTILREHGIAPSVIGMLMRIDDQQNSMLECGFYNLHHLERVFGRGEGIENDDVRTGDDRKAIHFAARTKNPNSRIDIRVSDFSDWHDRHYFTSCRRISSMIHKFFLISVILTVGAALAGDDRELFNFSKQSDNWFVVNDGVMGGVSSSTVKLENGFLVFEGQVRLENNGGFASVRSNSSEQNLSEFAGISLRLRGDGKMYALNLRTSSARGVLYQSEFQTKASEWLELRIPFSQLRPTRFGNTLKGFALEANRIESFGFIIANKRQERFELVVDWIKAYR